MTGRGRRLDTTEITGGMTTTEMTEDITGSTETETTMGLGPDTETVDTLTIITTTSLTTTDLWHMTAGLGGADLCTEPAVCLREISRAIKVITTTSESPDLHTPGDLTATWGTTGDISTVLIPTWATMTTLKGPECNEIVFATIPFNILFRLQATMLLPITH